MQTWQCPVWDRGQDLEEVKDFVPGKLVFPLNRLKSSCPRSLRAWSWESLCSIFADSIPHIAYKMLHFSVNYLTWVIKLCEILWFQIFLFSLSYHPLVLFFLTVSLTFLSRLILYVAALWICLIFKNFVVQFLFLYTRTYCQRRCLTSFYQYEHVSFILMK